MTVKLEQTQGKRRLHIGSYFTDLNENDYQELVKIFSAKSRPDSCNQYSESDVYTAINMARGVTFQTDREPKFHHTNKEIVEYLQSLPPSSKQPKENMNSMRIELLGKCKLGLQVLKTMLNKAGLDLGVKRAEELIKEIDEAI